MNKKEFLKKVHLYKEDGKAFYRLSECLGKDEYRVTFYVSISKANQTFREAKSIYGHITITDPELMVSKGDLSQFKKQIDRRQKEMYKVFLKQFPNQEEQLIFY